MIFASKAIGAQMDSCTIGTRVYSDHTAVSVLWSLYQIRRLVRYRWLDKNLLSSKSMQEQTMAEISRFFQLSCGSANGLMVWETIKVYM